jgi:hypothetical protein
VNGFINSQANLNREVIGAGESGPYTNPSSTKKAIATIATLTNSNISHNSSNLTNSGGQKNFFNNQSCTGGSKSQGEKIFVIKPGNGGVTRIGLMKKNNELV